MLTLKFFKTIPDSDQIQTQVICTHRYEKTQCLDGTIFLVHGLQDQPNIEFRVDAYHDKTHSFQNCYVENISGKTIDRAVAPELKDLPVQPPLTTHEEHND